MARRKQGAAQPVEFTPIEEAAPHATLPTPERSPGFAQAGETATAVLEAPGEEPPARRWRANSFPIKTVNLDGYKVQLQESRPEKESRADKDKPTRDERWQMQIKFGNGSKDDMPPEAVIEFIKSQKKAVTTKEGKETEVQLFHWNKRDQAWGMEIDYNARLTSRLKAEDVFREVVGMVAEERGVSRQR
jgi:hypothetical protein